MPLLVACGRTRHSELGSVVVRPQPPPPPAPVTTAEAFRGVGALSPRTDGFDVTWDPVRDAGGGPSDDFAYRVYVALDGAAFDFTASFATTAAGVSGFTLGAISVGARVSVVVQAESLADPADVDTNEIALDGVVATLWYVDAAAPAGGDGRTATAALRTIGDTVQAVVLSATPGNVLVAGGTYGEALLLPGDVHLYGGYDAAFATRDRAAHPSTLRPALANAIAAAVVGGAAPTFVDGLDVEGDGLVGQAVVANESDLQWSNGAIHETANEGVRAVSVTRPSLLRLRELTVFGCHDEGLFADGSFVAELTACTFRENGDEGIHFDTLSVQPAGRSELWLRDCVFHHDDNDGVEVEIDELDPLVGGTSLDGVIDVLVERCVATENRRRGLLVDFDFETSDRMTASVILRGNTCARQTEDGIRVDADTGGLFVLVGNRTSANGGCGVEIAGGSTRATVIVANHWEIGSMGDGVCAENHVPTLLSHVAVTGSGGVSISGNGSTLLFDGALWRCAAPLALDAAYSYADFFLAGVGNFEGAPGASVAPVQLFDLLSDGSDRDRFPLPPGETLERGNWIELRDDGIARRVDGMVDGEIVFDPPQNAPPAADSLVSRFEEANVVEDARLLPGSGWQDAGDPLDQDADGSVTDVGILGGTLETFVPLRSSGRVPFVVLQMTPPPGTAAGPVAEIRCRFTRPLDATTVSGATFPVLVNGVAVAGTWSVVVDQIVFVPSVPLSGGTVEVQVHSEIAATSGEHVALPYRYRIQVP